MKRVKTNGVPVVVNKPTPDAPEFFGSGVPTTWRPLRPAATGSLPTAGATNSQAMRKRFRQGICLRGTRGEGQACAGRARSAVSLSFMKTWTHQLRRYVHVFVLLTHIRQLLGFNNVGFNRLALKQRPSIAND